MRRLPLTPAQVGIVSVASGCCHATIRRWLHGHAGHRAQDNAIATALRELDLHPTRLDPLAAVDREAKQLLMEVVETTEHGVRDVVPPMPPEPPSHGAENIGLLAALERAQQGARWLKARQMQASVAPPPTGPRGGMGPSKSRCRVTILDENGEVMQP